MRFWLLWVCGEGARNLQLPSLKKIMENSYDQILDYIMENSYDQILDYIMENSYDQILDYFSSI